MVFKNFFASYLPRTRSRPTSPNIEFSLHLSKRKTRGKKISTRRLFNYTNLHGATPQTRTVGILRTRKAGRKSTGTRTWPFCPLTPYVGRRNLPVFLAPLHPRTKCYPCSLTLISRMQYNREHNLEIARIILATGLIKACMCSVCSYKVFRNYGNQL